MGSTTIVDLEDIVKTRAWTLYKRSRKFWQPGKLNDVKLEVDWSGVSFTPEKPKFTKKSAKQNETNQSNDVERDESTHHAGSVSDVETESNHTKDKVRSKRPMTSIIFTSVFENNSKLKQTHSLKAERNSTVTCKSSLTSGFTTGRNVGLTLACPKSIVKASVGYSEGFSLTEVTESTEQRTLTWTIEGSLIVPPESKLKAEVHIIETREQFLFDATVAIKGFVGVKISKRRNNKFMKTYSGDMQTIISEASQQNRNFKVAKTEGDTVFVSISGQCLFSYGIKQQTVISKAEGLCYQEKGSDDRDTIDHIDKNGANKVEDVNDTSDNDSDE